MLYAIELPTYERKGRVWPNVVFKYRVPGLEPALTLPIVDSRDSPFKSHPFRRLTFNQTLELCRNVWGRYGRKEFIGNVTGFATGICIIQSLDRYSDGYQVILLIHQMTSRERYGGGPATRTLKTVWSVVFKTTGLPIILVLRNWLAWRDLNPRRTG